MNDPPKWAILLLVLIAVLICLGIGALFLKLLESI